jgi:hypothetical protein
VDPISLVVAALAAGAAAGLTDAARSAVADAYASLKARLRRHIAGDRDAENRLDELERQPAADTGPLAERLRTTAADRDRELIATARAVLERLDPQGARAGKYDVRISGGKGIVVGDHATVTMNFSDDD